MELICVIAILGILVAIAVPSYRGIQDKSAEQVAISNARSNYTLGKAQQDMLDAGVIKESEKEEYHFDKDKNSAYWAGQINGRTYKAVYDGDTGVGSIRYEEKGHEEKGKLCVYSGGTDCGGCNPVHTFVYRGV